MIDRTRPAVQAPGLVERLPRLIRNGCKLISGRRAPGEQRYRETRGAVHRSMHPTASGRARRGSDVRRGRAFVRHPAPQVRDRAGDAARPGIEDRARQRRFQSQFGGDPLLILFEAAPSARHDRAAVHPGKPRRPWRGWTPTSKPRGDFHSVISPLTDPRVREDADRTAHGLAAGEARGGRGEGDGRRARAASAARGETPAQQDAAAAAAKQKVDDDVQRGVRRGRQALSGGRRPHARQPEVRPLRAVRRGRQACGRRSAASSRTTTTR